MIASAMRNLSRRSSFSICALRFNSFTACAVPHPGRLGLPVRRRMQAYPRRPRTFRGDPLDSQLPVGLVDALTHVSAQCGCLPPVAAAPTPPSIRIEDLRRCSRLHRADRPRLH